MPKFPPLTLRRAGISLLIVFGLALVYAMINLPRANACGFGGCQPPKYSLDVSHCYDVDKDEFRISMKNTGDKATWRLNQSYGSAYIPNSSGVELISGATADYTTKIEAKWYKELKDRGSWDSKGDFYTSKKHSPKCEPEVTPTPTPTPTPEPSTEPTPTPTPSNGGDNGDDGEDSNKPKGKHTSLSYETNCTDYTITASFHTTDNDDDVENVNVIFKYDGKEVRTTTNTSGYAYATFPYASSERELTAEGIDFGSQRTNVQYICTVEVLGASTEMAYAATGKFTDRVLMGLIAISTASIIAGAWLQIKQS